MPLGRAGIAACDLHPDCDMRELPASLEPPVALDENGDIRRVGVELELTSMEVRDIAAVVATMFDGTVRWETDYCAYVDSSLGEFRVEFDLALLQRIGEQRAAEEDGAGLFATARDAVASIAESVAPLEVVGPPIPYTELPRLDALAAALRKRGGRGTKAGLLAVLGLQLNPQVPRPTAECIHAHLRAYAVLAPWLRLRRGVDISRRATRYVAPYPASYVRLLLSQRTAPSLDQLCDEYLEHNPTRNRALDALPLFMHVRPERVRAVIHDERVKARPAFHYRLPDSRVGDPSWRVTDEWRHWLVVERIAARRQLLDELAKANLALESSTWMPSDRTWAERCERLLGETSYATR